MSMEEEKDTSWEERLKEALDIWVTSEPGSPVLIETMENFIRQEREALLKEIIDLSDKIELEGDDGGTGQWKAFKHLRNTLRDKL